MAIRVKKSVKMKNARLVVIAEVAETVLITTEATMIAVVVSVVVSVVSVVVAIMIVAVATNLGQANKDATTRIMVKESSRKEAEMKQQERTVSKDRGNSVLKQQPWCIRSQQEVAKVQEKASSVVAGTTTIAGVDKPPAVTRKKILLSLRKKTA